MAKKQKNKSLITQITSHRFVKKADAVISKWYFFPLILFSLVMVCTAFKVHGSSVGMYHKFLFGAEAKDPDLLAGRPRAIRSDEWLSNTPLTVSQYYNNYPTVNEDLGFGHDMTVVKDWADKSWVSIFKPQNWAFFALPLENAFAFRWAMLSFMLLTAAYFFVRELTGKTKLAIILSLILYFSPFFHWWYLATTLGSAAYVLFGLVALMRLHKTRSLRNKFIYSGLLTFIAVSFMLILYPPFQISAAFAGSFFYLGFVLFHFKLHKKSEWIRLFKDLAVIAVGLALAGALIILYYFQHHDVIQAIMNSKHPGERHIKSGDRDLKYFVHEFSSHFLYRLQSPRAGFRYWTNQSEASNFILIFPSLIAGAGLLVYKDFKKKVRPDFLLIVPTILLLLVLARQYMPGVDFFFNLFALDRVQNYRIIMALGLGQFILLVTYLRRAKDITFNERYEKVVLYLTTGLSFVSFLAFGLLTAGDHSDFLSNRYEILIVSAFMTVSVYFILRAKWIGLLMLAGFSFFSVVAINPVYRGLEPVYENKLTQAIRQSSAEEDVWAVVDSGDFENYAAAAGRPSISGLYSYPRKDLWEKAGILETTNPDIYDRSAHVLVTLDRYPQRSETYLQLVAANRYFVVLNPCSDFVDNTSLDYLLSQKPLENKCIKEVSKVEFPARTFYIYEVLDN